MNLACMIFQQSAVCQQRLLMNFPDVRATLKNHYHEILIDEFQDTSLVQNLFIEAIGNDNVFYGW